jgi:hypothetical protein
LEAELVPGFVAPDSTASAATMNVVSPVEFQLPPEPAATARPAIDWPPDLEVPLTIALRI